MLRLIVGPMCSGKTSRLRSELTRYADLGFSVLIINSAIDTRPGVDGLSSHSSDYQGLSKKISVQKVLRLQEAKIDDYQIIGVDESQFFSDLLTVNQWVDDLGKTVYVAGLDGDVHRNPFGKILDLIPMADKIEKITAVCCRCVEENGQLVDAPFTRLTITEEMPDDHIRVGGTEMYVPVCRRHYRN